MNIKTLNFTHAIFFRVKIGLFFRLLCSLLSLEIYYLPYNLPSIDLRRLQITQSLRKSPRVSV